MMRVAVPLVLLLVLAMPAAAQEPPGPAVAIDAKDLVYDAGTVKRGTRVTHTFVLKNAGGAPLSVDAKPGWGCTLAEFDKAILPGGEGKITAALDTSHYRGPIMKSVRVTTNDPARKAFVLQLKALVRAPVDVQPDESLTLEGKPGAVAPVEATLVSSEGTRFDVLGVEADPSLVVTRKGPAPPRSKRGKAVKPGETTKPGEQQPLASGESRYVFTIGAKPDAPIGRSVKAVTFTTNHPEAVRLPVRVTLIVTGDVQVSPERLVLTTPDPGEYHVKISRPEGKPLKILGAESSDADLKAAVKTLRVGREYEVTVRYVGKPGRGVLRASITVKTDDRRQPTIVVPVTGRI